LRIELITIGDELLLGFTIDTNGAHLARELGAVGVEIARRTSVGDRADDIAAAVGDAIRRTGAVITTGGLGPTSDDLTKPAIAALFGRPMRFDPVIYAGLEAMWAARPQWGPMPAANRQQAYVPEGATILENRHGSAPGIWLEDDTGRWVAMLPGVPREMRGMLADHLVPRLTRLVASAPGGDVVVRSRTLRTVGIGESALAGLLGDLADGAGGLPLAYLPGTEGVDLRLTARGLPAAEADERLGGAVALLRARIGRFVYGEGSDDLAALVLAACRERHLTIAVGESCTGGVLGARLTAVPGSSDVFLGGVIAYDNSVKESLLDVPSAEIRAEGSVSEPVARALALGARARIGADVGIGVTGVAGPGGGTPEKPVGTVWIAVAGPGAAAPVAVQTRRTMLVGDRGEIRQRAAQIGLDMVRQAVTTTPA
jgi:nicotinamide-nucleotide amidase